MKEISLVGIDIAKSVFQVCAMNSAGEIVMERRFSRAAFERFLRELAPCRVAMEACGGAHHWGRLAQDLGHDVTLYHPRRVAAFTGAHKSDRHDSRAICEVARLPTSQAVPVKSQAQQELQSLNRLRSGLIKQRTQTINRLRGLLAEQGQCFPKGRRIFLRRIGAWLIAPQGVSAMMVEVIAERVDEIRQLDRRITKLTGLVERTVKAEARGCLLMTIPGVGPIIAACVLAKVEDPGVFASARHFAAWIGLVPRQIGTGGKVRLGPITKHGDPVLRCNLVHGARSLTQATVRRGRPRDALEAWILANHARLDFRTLLVAVANRLSRIVWALLRDNQAYRPRTITLPLNQGQPS